MAKKVFYSRAIEKEAMEALYWAQKCLGEVEALIDLDMAVPVLRKRCGEKFRKNI